MITNNGKLANKLNTHMYRISSTHIMLDGRKYDNLIEAIQIVRKYHNNWLVYSDVYRVLGNKCIYSI